MRQLWCRKSRPSRDLLSASKLAWEGRKLADKEVERLARLIRAKNEADRKIAALIGRPATSGNIGEYIAAKVFAIKLMSSGSHPGYDGVFQSGHLASKTVNIKTYSRHESVLDISPDACDYYLVLAGPPGQARILPWVIDSVFLFDRRRLVAELTSRAVRVGVATSVRKADWEAARVFPHQPASPLQLTTHQTTLLGLFSAAAAARNDPATMSVSALFDPEPETWGLRGDPYLWRALRKRLVGEPMPGSPDEVLSLLHAAFEQLVGTDLASDAAEMAYREQYAHGGMSSGMIGLDTWRQQLMPLLAERARTLLLP
jgi:hypothetical protein